MAPQRGAESRVATNFGERQRMTTARRTALGELRSAAARRLGAWRGGSSGTAQSSGGATQLASTNREAITRRCCSTARERDFFNLGLSTRSRQTETEPRPASARGTLGYLLVLSNGGEETHRCGGGGEQRITMRHPRAGSRGTGKGRQRGTGWRGHGTIL
jgi:hypothetical protein